MRKIILFLISQAFKMAKRQILSKISFDFNGFSNIVLYYFYLYSDQILNIIDYLIHLKV